MNVKERRNGSKGAGLPFARALFLRWFLSAAIIVIRSLLKKKDAEKKLITFCSFILLNIEAFIH